MRSALSIEKLKSVYGLIAKRYDLQHTLITAGTDQRGRKLLVERAISEGNRILDCGSGTGKTGIMAVKKAGPDGHVILFDLSDDMLEVARQKVIQEGLQDRVEFRSGERILSMWCCPLIVCVPSMIRKREPENCTGSPGPAVNWRSPIRLNRAIRF